MVVAMTGQCFWRFLCLPGQWSWRFTMTFICFAGTYKPIMCGIGDYASFITRVSPAEKWGVLSFDLGKCKAPIVSDREVPAGGVWHGIPGRHGFSAPVILEGLDELGVQKGDSVLWFQHEFGIWPGNMQFLAMLKNLDMPKVVTFHTLHFQSTETATGLRKEQYNLLRILLRYVDAITVFSRGVYNAVTSALPEYSEKVYIIKHGVHSYPEVSRLSRKEAKEKFNDFLLYDSELDRGTKEILHRERLFLDRGTTIIGQAGFLSPSKNSELLYTVRDRLQKLIPKQRIVAVRIGTPRDEIQKIYAERLRKKHVHRDKFLLKTWLPQDILPLAQRAFDVNFYWPIECTQSGVLAHALGAGAIIAGRDLEGVGETLKDAGEPIDTDLGHLLLKIKRLILNPELAVKIEERALSYAAEYSWENQARRHYQLVGRILSPSPTRTALRLLPLVDTVAYNRGVKSVTARLGEF